MNNNEVEQVVMKLNDLEYLKGIIMTQSENYPKELSEFIRDVQNICANCDMDNFHYFMDGTVAAMVKQSMLNAIQSGNSVLIGREGDKLSNLACLPEIIGVPFFIQSDMIDAVELIDNDVYLNHIANGSDMIAIVVSNNLLKKADSLHDEVGKKRNAYKDRLYDLDNLSQEIMRKHGDDDEYEDDEVKAMNNLRQEVDALEKQYEDINRRKNRLETKGRYLISETSRHIETNFERQRQNDEIKTR